MTKRELEQAMQEENEALLAFAALSKKCEGAELEKRAARCRLQIARDTKRALLDDLMTL